MNRRIEKWDRTSYPYKLMYKRNEITNKLDIVKVYKNEQGEFTHYDIVGRG